MKFALAFSSILAVSALDLSPDSTLGKKLMSNARRLDQNAFDDSWITSYSIKFQGCYAIKQWNYEANEDEDVRIASKNLVRFRLCPTDSCSANKGGGCSTGYGEYVVDMYDFMASWYEASQQDIEYSCWAHLNTNCNCDKDNNQADDFNEEYCEYNCFNDANMPQCIERNPYEEEQGNNKNQFNVEEYVKECRQFKAQNGRQLNDNNNNKYYVGPYCAGQGGDIFLGLFSDDACTIPVEDTDFQTLAGYELPYSSSSLVNSDCITCLEHKEEDNKNQQEGGEADADAVSEACETLYIEAGKCESNLPEGITSTPNTNACSYMEGIKIVRQDGMIFSTKAAKANVVATTFIVIFAVAFAGMAFYVHYLRTRLGAKQNPLLN